MRSFELSEEIIDPPFSIDTIKYIHKKLFGDIYEWAGEFRNIDISKGNSRFANVAYIESSLNEIFGKLVKDSFLYGLDRDDFVKKAAGYMSEINAVHPFRDGNGRTQRELINQLAYNAGYYITWNKIDPEEILNATIASFHSDTLALEKIILENLRSFEEL